VIPARSRLGQSRFNFRLLRDYAREFGKRIAIISVEPQVQRLAQENGFNVFAHLDEYETPGVERTLVAAGVSAAGASELAEAHRALRPAGLRSARAPRLTVKPQARPLAAGTPGSRFALYLGAGLVALVLLIGSAVLVPSATVTLTAHAQPLSSTVAIDAAPNSAPVKVRLVSSRKEASRQFKATGLKVTPAVAAAGSVTFSNKCPDPISVRVSQGQIVSTGAATQYVVQANIDRISPGQSSSAAVLANVPGVPGNTGAGTVTVINNEPAIISSCFTVNNPAPIANGADEVKQTFVSQADLDSGRAQLEGDVRGVIADDLGKQAAGTEKLSDAIDYKSDFASDHKANDPVSVFNGTVSMTGNGAAYSVDDVKRAMASDLARHVPSGFLMTDNPVQSEFHVTQAVPDGHISFTGTARGFVAPKLDYDKIRGRLTGASTASARLYLGTLPVESARVKEKPISLPLLPLLSSRIDLRYVVDTAPAKPAG
ncbi:MAG: baseplate J/gp47 family protein, partial [Candidatus Dormibacteraeota bacterium]|nr:baseplate J/gp47 family protein [Candidatus Dormibacteraeota bacterium]